MPHGGHKFDSAHRACLDSPERRGYLDPDGILSTLGVGPGMVLADVGAGTGFFTFAAARRVGPGGRVFAVDLAQEMLADVRSKIAKDGGSRVEVVASTEDSIPLPDRSVDFVFLACVLHELAGPGTLRECRRILRRQGRVGVVDWHKIDQEIGPPRAHRLSEAEARALLRRAGFATERVFEAGPYHYGIEARIAPA